MCIRDRNITVRNVDILEHDEDDLLYQGCMAVYCGDKNLVRKVLFEDIRVAVSYTHLVLVGLTYMPAAPMGTKIHFDDFDKKMCIRDRSSSHRHFDQSDIINLSGKSKHFGSFGTFCANRCKPVGSFG